MYPYWLILTVYCSWDVLGLVWLFGLLRRKRVVQRQDAASHFRQRSLTILSYILLFWHSWRYSPLARHLLPLSRAGVRLGAVLTVAGCLFAIWARVLLGGNWSMNVTIKQDHTLMTRGPYAIVRHPIYTGLLLAALGTALFQDAPLNFLGVALLFYAFWNKLHDEENFMRQQFGAQYAQYSQRVRALIPGML